MKSLRGLAIRVGLIVATVAGAGLRGGLAADPVPAGKNDIVVSFRGQIGGSEQLTITPTRATWEHGIGEEPNGPVALNGIAWNPIEQASLSNEGSTRFLPRPVDFLSARLVKKQARDVVVLERHQGSVVVHIIDTPNFSAPYEFDIVFRPASKGKSASGEADSGSKARPRPGTKRAKLRIVVEIDGSDQLIINNEGAEWVHGQWDWPGEVSMNQVKWNPMESPTLKNEGETKFLKGPVDFSTAKMTKTTGRDTVVLERSEKGLILYFADNELSSATYDVTVSFGD